MTDKEYKVSNLSLDHLSEVSCVWLESLPDNFKAIIGKKIIDKYLNEIFLSNKCLKKGIFKSNELLGFVFFGNDKSIIRRLFLKN